MKKLISFLILFIPWNVSLLVIYFTNLNLCSMIFILFSFILYLFITKYLYNNIKKNLINKDFIYNISLFYIINQSFNLCLFYYKFIFLSIILFISMITILFKLKK